MDGGKLGRIEPFGPGAPGELLHDAPLQADQRRQHDRVQPAGPPVDGVFYDPYDPGTAAPPTSTCPGGGGGGDGEGDGGDFASTCSSLGGTLSHEFGCLEEWDTETNEWATVWCGTYAVCET